MSNGEIAAYIAAAIDGEGCITFKTRRDSRSPWLFDVRVYITNTNRQWLEWFQDRIGGQIHTSGKKIVKRKQGYRLSLDGAIAQSLLRNIRPYLLLKAPQADLALSYTPIKQGTYGRFRGKMSDELRIARTSMFLQMKALNKRGE